MKTIIKNKCRLLVCCFAFLTLSLMQHMTAKAEENADLPYILVESYRLTDDKVIPGKEFTLTLKIKNNSRTVTAYDVMINISNPNGIMPVYGEVSQQMLAKIEPQESVEVSFDYISMAELVGDYVDFYVSLAGTAYNNVVVRVPMGVDSPFTILAFSVPTTIYAEEIASANVSFKVLGDANVRNVYLELQMNDKVITRSAVGTMTPGVTRTQNLSPMISTPGIYEAKLVLYYDDETDQTQSVTVGTTSVTVEKRAGSIENDGDSDSTQTQQEEDKFNKGILMGAGGIIILLVLAICVWIMRRKK